MFSYLPSPKIICNNRFAGCFFAWKYKRFETFLANFCISVPWNSRSCMIKQYVATRKLQKQINKWIFTRITKNLFLKFEHLQITGRGLDDLRKFGFADGCWSFYLSENQFRMMSCRFLKNFALFFIHFLIRWFLFLHRWSCHSILNPQNLDIRWSFCLW